MEREKTTTKARGKKKGVGWGGERQAQRWLGMNSNLSSSIKEENFGGVLIGWKVWIFLVMKETGYCTFMYFIWPESKTLDLPPTHPPFEGVVFTHLVFSLVRQMLRFERLMGLAMLLLTSDIHREHSSLLQIQFDLIKWHTK